MERRRFLAFVATTTGAAAALVVGLPLLGHLLAPLRRKAVARQDSWIPVGEVSLFERGEPRRIAVPITVQDAWETKTEDHAAWVVAGDDAALRVYSSTCPHLGCSVKWQEQAGAFRCPCHESSFSIDGNRRHGPARRGLDELPSRIVDGRLEIQWVDYVANIAEREPVGGAA